MSVGNTPFVGETHQSKRLSPPHPGEHTILLQLGFQARVIEADVGSVCVWEATGSGSLPTFACLHGFSFQSSDLAALLSALRTCARRVIAVDLLGHGASRPCGRELTPASITRGVEVALDAAIAEPAILYGHSLGGLSALRYAIHKSDKLARLVLHAPSGASMSQHELAHVLRLFEVDDEAGARELVAHLWEAGPDFDPEALATRWLTRLSNPVLRSLLRTRTAGHSLTTAELRALQVPTLVLWPEKDRVLPSSSLSFFRDLAQGQVQVISGWGHCASNRDMIQIASWVHAFSSR